MNATYSKFVDIEIDPGGDCVEVVQHSKDAQDGTGGFLLNTNQSAESQSGFRARFNNLLSTCIC